MDKFESRRRLRAFSAATALAALGLAITGTMGCSSSGLHMPAILTTGPPAKAPAAAAAPTQTDSVAGAEPYTPPPAEPRSADTVDSVVASVDGNPITLHDVNSFGTGSKAATPTGEPAPDVPDDP